MARSKPSNRPRTIDSIPSESYLHAFELNRKDSLTDQWKILGTAAARVETRRDGKHLVFCPVSSSGHPQTNRTVARRLTRVHA